MTDAALQAFTHVAVLGLQFDEGLAMEGVLRAYPEPFPPFDGVVLLRGHLLQQRHDALLYRLVLLPDGIGIEDGADCVDDEQVQRGVRHPFGGIGGAGAEPRVGVPIRGEVSP